MRRITWNLLVLDFHANIPHNQQEVFEFRYLKNGLNVSAGRFFRLIEDAESISDEFTVSDAKALFLLQDGHDLTPGTYCLQIQKGRPGSKIFFLQEFRFFILPKLSLEDSENVYCEGDLLNVRISADALCFYDDEQGRFVNERDVDLGTVHLDRDFDRVHRISLQHPSLSFGFNFRPKIFACRLNSVEVSSAIFLEVLKKTPLGVFGPSGAPLVVKSTNAVSQVHFDQTGHKDLSYAFFKKHVQSQNTSLQLETEGKQIDIELLWYPQVQVLKYPVGSVGEGKLIFREAAYETKIIGPPNGQVLLRLINNLGETCGETVIKGEGLFKGAVKWTEEVTPTAAVRLKAFILSSQGHAIAANINELTYNAVTPEIELEIILKKAQADPSIPKIGLKRPCLPMKIIFILQKISLSG